MKIKLWALWCFLLSFTFYSYGQVQIGQDVFGRSASDLFGSAISSSGDGTIVAVSAIEGDIGGIRFGRVRVFQNTGNQWVQLGADVLGQDEDDFPGTSLSLNDSGTILAIGEPGRNSNGFDTGRVRVFQWNGSSWSQLGQSIDGPAAGNQLGERNTIALNAAGNRLVIGIPRFNSNRGRVQVYELVAGQWTQMGQSIDGVVVERLGAATSINDTGNIIALSAIAGSGSRIEVYELVNTTWTQIGQDIDQTQPSEALGSSLALNAAGDILVAGAPNAPVAGNNFTGVVRVFQNSNNAWTQVGADVEGENGSDQFGESVAINALGTRIAMGASRFNSNRGLVRIYEQSNNQWAQVFQDITDTATNTFTGYSIDLSNNGEIIVSGDRGHTNSNGSFAGRFRAFSVVNMPPDIANCPTNISQGNDISACSAVVTWTPPMASDSDGTITSFTSTHNPGDTFPVGSTTVTYTATDDAGATTDCSFEVIVNDTELPSLITQNITVQLNASGNATITTNDIDNGSSDNCAIATLALDITTFDCDDIGANTVTLTATDTSGNTNTTTATVTVDDIIAPTFTPQNATAQLDANGQVTLNPEDYVSAYQDNCTSGVVSLYSVSPSEFDCDDLGVNTITVTVSDSSGNTTSATATVTIQENIPLTAIAQDITVQLDSNGLATIAAADVDNGSGSGCNSTPTLSTDISNFNCDDIGSNTVTLTVTDGTNTETATATVTVVDNLNPNVLTQDITVQLDANGQAIIAPSDIDNGSSDNCTIASLTLDKTSFNCSDLGPNTVTLSITDGSGNISTGTATVTITDNIDPVATTQDITIQLDASGNATINPTDIDNGSSDNCSITSIALDTSSFSCAELGQNTVTLTVTDTSGNTAMATAVVTVQENPNQQLTASAQDITVQLDANGLATIAAGDVDNGSGSGCNSTPTLSLDVSSFDCSDLGANTVTLTVTDGTDTETATATVTVVDTLDPSVLTQDITVQLNANGQASIVATDIDNGSVDNCVIATRSLDISTFDCSDVGSNTVTLTVTDSSGNIASATATVTVTESIVPIALAQDITVELDTSGNVTINASDIDNGSSDNCTIASISLDTTAYSCADLGQNTVTLTVTDTSGNASTATAVVTVEENTNQQLTAITQDITVQLDANGAVSITPQDVDNGSGSGCNSTPSLSLDISSFDCSSLGQNTVILTATEGSVSATATAIVTVEDTLAPNVVAQNITVDLDANNMASITVADIDNGTSDNCTASSGISLSLDQTMFGCSDLGENTVTLTAIDGNGNSGTATAIVTVRDVTPPTVVTQDIQVSLDADGNASITPEQINNGSSDDCSGVDTLSLDVTTFSCPSLGNVTVTLTVTDASGNSATGTATVNITAEDLDSNGIADACENQELVVSKGFSPNGDNRNDTWTIENIEDYPNARVSVFNRWGEKVYEQVGYQNDWDAVSNQISTSRRLPAGSYLYIIETNNPEVAPLQGWMYINY